MKDRSVTILFLVLLLIMSLSNICFADDLPTIFINDKQLNTQYPPVVENGRTLVPLRDLFENVNHQVLWNESDQSIKSDNIWLQIDNHVAKIGDKQITLDVPAKLINDKTYVPLRFISESLGLKVNFDEKNNSINISNQDVVNNTNNIQKLFINGATYEGEIGNGKPNRQGTMTWQDGSIYVGSWKNGVMEGFGKLTKPNFGSLIGNLNIYEGQFKNGKMDGYGTITWVKENIKYEGNFCDGEFDGTGKRTWADGSVHEEMWKHGTMIVSTEDTNNNLSLTNVKKLIIGGWKGQNSKYDFWEDGSCVETFLGTVSKGKYSFIDPNHIKIMFWDSGTYVRYIKFSGNDRMIMKEEGYSPDECTRIY